MLWLSQSFYPIFCEVLWAIDAGAVTYALVFIHYWEQLSSLKLLFLFELTLRGLPDWHADSLRLDVRETLGCRSHHEDTEVFFTLCKRIPHFPKMLVYTHPKMPPNPDSHFLLPVPPVLWTPAHKLLKSSCHLSHMPTQNSACHPHPQSPNHSWNKETNYTQLRPQRGLGQRVLVQVAQNPSSESVQIIRIVSRVNVIFIIDPAATGKAQAKMHLLIKQQMQRLCLPILH